MLLKKSLKPIFHKKIVRWYKNIFFTFYRSYICFFSVYFEYIYYYIMNNLSCNIEFAFTKIFYKKYF